MMNLFEDVRDIPTPLYRAMRDCTLRNKGTMQGELANARSGWYEGVSSFYVAVEWEDREGKPYVLGWSYATDNELGIGCEVYVKRQHRGKGIGYNCVKNVTQLYREQKKKFNVWVDDSNKNFWVKAKETLPIDY